MMFPLPSGVDLKGDDEGPVALPEPEPDLPPDNVMARYDSVVCLDGILSKQFSMQNAPGIAAAYEVLQRQRLVASTSCRVRACFVGSRTKKGLSAYMIALNHYLRTLFPEITYESIRISRLGGESVHEMFGPDHEASGASIAVCKDAHDRVLTAVQSLRVGGDLVVYGAATDRVTYAISVAACMFEEAYLVRPTAARINDPLTLVARRLKPGPIDLAKATHYSLAVALGQIVHNWNQCRVSLAAVAAAVYGQHERAFAGEAADIHDRWLADYTPRRIAERHWLSE